jgi:hypothetical protein
VDQSGERLGSRFLLFMYFVDVRHGQEDLYGTGVTDDDPDFQFLGSEM